MGEKGYKPVIDTITEYNGWGVVNREVYGEETEFPSYSTSIVAAWEVLEKMHDDKGAIAEVIMEYDGTYWCWIGKDVPDGAGTKEFVGSANADTAPLAICRAALLAVMEVEQNV
jgi:hypothetical protein